MSNTLDTGNSVVYSCSLYDIILYNRVDASDISLLTLREWKGKVIALQ